MGRTGITVVVLVLTWQTKGPNVDIEKGAECDEASYCNYSGTEHNAFSLER